MRLKADRARCAELIDQSLAMCTSLTPIIGYNQAVAIAKEAYKTGKTVRRVALDKITASELDMTEPQLSEALDARSMTEPRA